MFECVGGEIGGCPDPASATDAELSEALDRLNVLADRVDALRLAVAGEWDARALWAEEGAPNGASLLAGGGRLSRAAAAGLLKTARVLRRLPIVAAAVADGTLTPGKARVICTAVNPRTTDAAVGNQRLFCDGAHPLTVDQTAVFVRYWLAHADPDGPSGTDPEANTARITETFNGRFDLRGSLDAENGAVLAAIWSTFTNQIRRATRHDPDPLTPGRLRAAALIEMARRASATGDHNPAAAPSVLVTISAADLADPNGAARIGDHGIIGTAAVHRMCCDATVMRLVLDADNQPLTMGRAVRTATGAQRRLLAERDRGCSFPGCDRPPGWCQAHHIITWDHGGTTDIDNLTLVCDHHHHLVHDKHWAVRSDTTTRTVMWFKPDGTPHTPPPIAA